MTILWKIVSTVDKQFPNAINGIEVSGRPTISHPSYLA